MAVSCRHSRIVLTQLLIELVFLFSIAYCSESFRLGWSRLSSRLSIFSPTTSSSTSRRMRVTTPSVQTMTRIYSASKGSYVHPAAITNSYPGIPDNIEIEKLVVIHRHGDRAQISRTIGGKKRPYSQMDGNITAYWHDAVPSEDTLQKMERVARHGMIMEPYKGTASDVVFESDLYSGWDKDNYPYSQLTEVGAKQLMEVGRTLRDRYGDLQHSQTKMPILPPTLDHAQSHLFCRSTNICRTIQSLRSLLVGIFDKDINQDKKEIDDDKLPIIYTRPREYENIFPQVDGDCPAMASRRAIIFPHDLTKKTIPGYDAIEQRMMDILGYEDRVNWLTVKEVLTCHYVHNIQQIPDIREEDVHKATEIAGWIWGVLYKDDLLNRFAIGRFIDDVLHDISASSDGVDYKTSLARNKSCFIYSGHDSTLVPVMCGLGIYDDMWPDYAAYMCWEIAKDKLTGKRMVRVIYNNSVMELNKIPGTPSPFQTTSATIKMISMEDNNKGSDATSESSKGWYLLEDFERFVDRIRIDHDAYVVESRTHYHPAGVTDAEMKKAEDEAKKEGADDLSATLAATSTPNNVK